MTKRATVLSIAAAAAALIPAAPAAAALAPDTLRPIGLEPFTSCAQLDRYVKRHSRPPYPHGPIPMAADGAMEMAASAPGAARSTGGGAAGGAFSTTNVQEAGVDEPDIVKTDGSVIYAIAKGGLHVVDVSGAAPRRVGGLDLPGRGWGHQMLVHEDTVVVIWQAAAMREATVLARVDVSDPAAPRIVERRRVDGGLVAARMTGSTARLITRSYAGRLPKVPCTHVLRPRAHAGLDLVALYTIDLARSLEPLDTDTVMTGAETVYASPTAVYVATTPYLEPGRSELPRSLGTAIHRFDTSDPEQTTYEGSGIVQGHLLNQFSMSEHEGVLRVASTAAPQWWDAAGRPDSQSFVTTFRADPQTGALLELGSVGGLGHGERIYAVRFIGDAGYVVTFRETDPLYTIDLADPADPRVLGELKIRGYSAYLHPAGDDLLIGVGQDASRRGRTLGTQVSLFDVSDPGDPRRLAVRTLARGSSSEAEYDHHAFLYWAPTGLAMVPVNSWDGEAPESAAVGLRIGRETGIADVGRVEHPGADWQGVRRSLVAAGRLFTLSDSGLLASDLDSLAPRSWTPLG